jgi:DNA invertase Pin-like site-specific DNA recombinase
MDKVAVYLRVSTKDQTINTQRLPVMDYCKHHNLQIYREYSDEGVSGSTTSRPQFDLMLKDMRAGEFTTIIVYRLDRLGRSLGHLLQIFEELRNKKIQLISISDNINTADDSPTARAFWSLLGVFSQLEREIIVERVKAGLDRARREGKQLGRRVGSTDKSKRSVSGYCLRYAGKSKEERRLGPRNTREKRIDDITMSV